MLRPAIAVLTLGVVVHAGAATVPSQFPNTKSHGRATVQYQDERIKAVAIYDYSQRNHDTPWLLVQLGVAMRERTVVRREQLQLVASDGTVVPLARQQDFVADGAQLRKFRQNAGIFSRQLQQYFPQAADGDSMKFFALPGDGTISDIAVVPSSRGVVIGDLFFKSPGASWAPGVYRLVIDHQQARAELPIRLD